MDEDSKRSRVQSRNWQRENPFRGTNHGERMRCIALTLLAAVMISGCIAEQASFPSELEPTNYTIENITFNKTHALMFDNFRWNHMPVTIYMYTQNATDRDIEAFREGMKIWKDQTDGLVAFKEVDSPQVADITVRWTKEVPVVGEEAVELGTSMPKVIDTGLFNLSVGCEVTIVTKTSFSTSCPQLVAAHELGHALGLDHPNTTNPAVRYYDIMYPQLHCLQRVTPDILDTLKELYRMQPAPDLTFMNVTSTKRNVHLDIKMVVMNRGLLDSNATELQIKARSNVIGTFELPPIEPGSQLTITGKITVLSDITELELVIDPGRKNTDMYPNNNVMLLRTVW